MTAASSPLRVALVGAGKRAAYMYAPILRALKGDVELVAVWSRSSDSARRLGEQLAVPYFSDMAEMMKVAQPQIGVVNVSYGAGATVGIAAMEHGLHVLLETPIAHQLAEADAVIATSARTGCKVEVAEQFHRRPMEQIQLKLIASGAFGAVYSSFCDFAGNGYHGVSVMRSYLGFDQRPTQVVGSVRKYELSPFGPPGSSPQPKSESQQHGLVEFDSLQQGIFHWTDLAYTAPQRWWRGSRFLAQRGMGATYGTADDAQQRLTLVAPSGTAPLDITLRRIYERVDGGALVAVEAHTGDVANPLVRCDNPFVHVIKGQTPQWHDDEIAVASCLMSLVTAVRSGGQVSYGPAQARLDQEIIVAIRQSSLQGGQPIKLPMDVASQTV